MTKPTPGPWHHETDERGNVVIYGTRNGGDDKIIVGMSHFGPLEQREADARLIVASVRKCWFCETASTALHSHYGDYVPVCGDHLSKMEQSA